MNIDIPEFLEDDKEQSLREASRAIAHVVRELKDEIGADKIVVNVRIAPDATSVSVEPWEPYESETKAIVDSLVDRMIGRR